jgi:hypothetical protein
MSNAKWANNELQFARLIAEIEAAGGFTEQLVQDLCTSMDLEKNQITELIDRAQSHWDEAKDMPTTEELYAEGVFIENRPAGRNNKDEESIYELNDRRFSIYISNGEGEVPPGAVVSEIIEEDED